MLLRLRFRESREREPTLVVEVQLVFGIGTRFIVGEVFPQLFVVCDGSVQRFASRKTFPQLGPFLADLGIAKKERSPVQVVAPLSILSPLLRDACQRCAKKLMG